MWKLWALNLFVLAAAVNVIHAARVTTMGGVVHIHFNRQGNGNRSRTSTGSRRRSISLRQALSETFQDSFVGCSRALMRGPRRGYELSKVEKSIQNRVGVYVAPKNGVNKCAADCVLRRLQLMKDDGSLVSDMPMLEGIPNTEAKQVLRDQMKACIAGSKATSTDHCQRATDTVACFLLLENGVILSLMSNTTKYVGSILVDMSKNIMLPTIKLDPATMNRLAGFFTKKPGLNGFTTPRSRFTRPTVPAQVLKDIVTFLIKHNVASSIVNLFTPPPTLPTRGTTSTDHEITTKSETQPTEAVTAVHTSTVATTTLSHATNPPTVDTTPSTVATTPLTVATTTPTVATTPIVATTPSVATTPPTNATTPPTAATTTPPPPPTNATTPPITIATTINTTTISTTTITTIATTTTKPSVIIF